MRLLASSCLILIAVSLPVSGAEPVEAKSHVPQHERMLKGKDAKKAAELKRTAGDLEAAGKPVINGELSACEVLEYWKLGADLVTLSACETAFGQQSGGDGMLGITQAFLTADARSVCSSLWKVDDTATALLMIRFYHNLLGKRVGLTKPIPKAESLQGEGVAAQGGGAA